MNGDHESSVKDQNTVVTHQLMNKEECKHILDCCHERGLVFYLESNNGLFANENLKEKCNPMINVYCARARKVIADKQTTRVIFPEMIYDGELY